MINEKQIRQIFFGCGFKHALIKRSQKKRDLNKSVPRESSLNKVMTCISQHKKICVTSLMKKTGMSIHTANNCLAELLRTKKIVQELAGQAGPYNAYHYSKAV